MLAAREVVKEYRMGRSLVRALAGVSLEIAAGEFVAILGTSGSGKSTLLNLFGGLDRPTAGEIRFEGNNLAPLSAPALARHRLRQVGMVFQSFNLIATMSAWENVALALAFAGINRSERRRRAEALLAQVGLADRVAHRPAELSGGEQQRVAIARALANDPRALLADEPTGNLDSTHAAEILGLLKSMQGAGKTVVLVTHDQDLARTYADRCVRLKDGKVVAP
jgi:ABC-type lipoprotein export system ATPase subunit